MDCRIEPLQELGLHLGSAHVIRNAGGLITDDAIRSLAISQHKLNTDAIMIIQHTRCGLTSFDDDDFRAELESQTHSNPPWSPQPFGDQDRNVQDALTAARSSPFLPRREHVRGFIFDVDTGLLREISG
jgi:carbonic anhydrase